MMNAKSWVIIGGSILAVAAWVWYYASLGKSISEAEKKAGRDLTYEINPFTGKQEKNTKKHEKNKYNKKP
ncbi:hypothetical protein CN918_26760 [Priestia megaterium]|nr:hypothetical protein CN918_26760 [Priestia megaterium]